MAGQIGKLEMKIFRNDLHKLASLPIMLKKELEAILPRIGRTVETTILQHVQAQDLNWEKLNEDYKAWKARKGYSTATWIMTSSLTQSITYTCNPKDLSVFVGVHRTAGQHEHGGYLFEIAFVLEFGNLETGGKTPARPLFQPSLEQSKRSVETTVGIAVRKALKDFEATTTKPIQP